MTDRIQINIPDECRNIFEVATELSMLCVLKDEKMIDDEEYELVKRNIVLEVIKATSSKKGTDNG